MEKVLKYLIDEDFNKAYLIYGYAEYPNQKDFIADYIDILNSDIIESGINDVYELLYNVVIENYEYMTGDNKRRAIINYTENYLKEEYK